MTKLRVRRSLHDVQDDFQKGNKAELENLMRAWKGIKELPPDDPNSFFMIAGYHGEPFRGAGWGNAAYWGGYCNHGNVLFPTWHRVYVLKLEEALRSIPGCADVTMPYWDETNDELTLKGIPSALTDEKFLLDGVQIDNPLRSFKFPRTIRDHIPNDPLIDYSKEKGYETVRYPLSGLVGTATDKEATKQHNAQFPTPAQQVALLNQNVVNWLGSVIVVDGKPRPTNVKLAYQLCLEAPNYTVFSNGTSRAEWNDNHPRVVSLENPHNSIHLAVGGFNIPNQPNFSPIPGSNGDMGENDTAGFDPILFFHHCFIDRVFWLWQKKHGFTDHLEIIPGYPGTNSVDSQNPTPGTAPNSWLSLDSPLDPFDLKENGTSRAYTSRDCIDIEKQLGYTYGPGSLEPATLAQPAARAIAATEAPSVRVSGINRASIRGSFLISAFANIEGKRVHIGTEAVLSRWHVEGCVNCQTHLQARATISLGAVLEKAPDPDKIEVEVMTRDGLLDGGPRTRSAFGAAARLARRPSFKVEIR